MLAALYQCCQTRPLSSDPKSGWFPDSQPANQPAAPSKASTVLRLLFSLLTHIHPSWLDRLVPLLLSFFAPLGLWRWASPWRCYCYRLQCSSSARECSPVNTFVNVYAVPHFPLPPAFVWLFLSESTCSRYLYFLAFFGLSGQLCLMHRLPCLVYEQDWHKENGLWGIGAF